MSRVAEVWNTLDDEQRLAVSRALRISLGEPGVQLIIAIARESAPPPAAGPTCDGCHSDGQLTALMTDERTVLMLCNTCWKARMNARLRAPLQDGAVGQPFPTSHHLEGR